MCQFESSFVSIIPFKTIHLILPKLAQIYPIYMNVVQLYLLTVLYYTLNKNYSPLEY